MRRILLSTVGAVALVSLLGLAGVACGRDEFTVAYLETRAEVLRESANRFGPGRLAQVSWSSPLSPPTSASALTESLSGDSSASTRGSETRVLSPIEYAKRGLEDLVDPGEGFTLDRVVEYYELAFSAGQRDPTFLNDYAFALLERGLPRDLILGGEYAARARKAAVKSDPGGDLAQAARFNWAVALERLALHGQATQAWQEVLEHETDLAWRTEAEAHADDLAQWPVARWPEVRERLRQAAAGGDTATVAAILPEFRTAVRLLAEDDELRVWADTVERDPIRAQEALAIVRTLGEALQPTDALLAEVVAEIDVARGDVQRTGRLATAIREFFRGLEQYKEFAYESARPQLADAAAELAALGSPLSFRAEFLSLASSDQLGLADILDAYDGFLERVPQEYAVLQAQALYGRGRAQVTAGYPETSILDLQMAVAALEHLGETDLEPAYRSELENALKGAHREGDATREAGLWIMKSNAVVQPYYRLFLALAAQAQAGWLDASMVRLAANREALQAAMATGRESLLADARTGLLTSFGQLRLFSETDQLRAELRASIDRIEDPGDRRRSKADLLRAEASLPARPGAPSRRDLLQAAFVAYEGDSEAIEGAASEWVLQRVSVLRELAQESLASGYFARARETAEQAFDLLALRSASVEQTRLSYAAEVRPTVDLRLLASLEDPAKPDADRELFRWVERGHHLSAPGTWIEPSTADQIQAEIPEGTTVVELAALENRVLVVVLRSGAVGSWWLEVPNLEEVVGCIDPRSAGCATSWDENAERFATIAVEPWLCGLPDGERLVLVPGSLARIPFAALPIQCGSESKRRLVHRHVSSLAPSATFWTKARIRASELSSAGPPTRVLAIGVREAMGFETQLEYAEDEAEAVAGVYPVATRLLGLNATQAAIQERAALADVLHFATHGAVDPDDPNGSYLALAETRLQVHDLGGLSGHLPGTRLAVLSACETGGSIVGIEALVGVSRAFLEIGVPNVVATLSRVDDEYSRDLMTRFHALYQITGDAVLAVGRAQREMSSLTSVQMERSRLGRMRMGPPEWAQWVVVGGSE